MMTECALNTSRFACPPNLPLLLLPNLLLLLHSLDPSLPLSPPLPALRTAFHCERLGKPFLFERELLGAELLPLFIPLSEAKGEVGFEEGVVGGVKCRERAGFHLNGANIGGGGSR
jgi:hypothetical protein